MPRDIKYARTKVAQNSSFGTAAVSSCMTGSSIKTTVPAETFAERCRSVCCLEYCACNAFLRLVISPACQAAALPEEAVTAAEEHAPCDLGKKSHWDTEFGRDLAIFRETGDPGYAWFEEQLGSRLVTFFESSPHVPEAWRALPVLDVGCGNGQMLMDLHDLGYTDVHGVDYCEAAVELCREFLVDSERPADGCFAKVRPG